MGEKRPTASQDFTRAPPRSSTWTAPLGVGVVLFFGGSPVAVVWKVAYAVIVTVFFGWLLHLNRRAVATELEPRLRELDGLLASLEHQQVDPHAAGGEGVEEGLRRCSSRRPRRS
jgi:hypothetical protein